MEDPKNPGYDLNGDPLVQGVVDGKIQPIVFKDPKASEASAVGAALDENGNVIDQTGLPR